MRNLQSNKRFNPFGVEVGKITESGEDLTYWQQVSKSRA